MLAVLDNGEMGLFRHFRFFLFLSLDSVHANLVNKPRLGQLSIH